MIHGFNTKSLRNFMVETVQSEIPHRLLPILSSKRVSINLQYVIQRFAFDNICRVTFGVDHGYLDPSLSDLPFARAFDTVTKTCFGRFFYSIPSLYIWKIRRFLNIGSERQLRQVIRVGDEFTMNIIRSRRIEIAESPSEKKDLLSRFMEVVTTWDGFNTNEIVETNLFLKEMVVNFMLVSRDTTSTSLTWFFWIVSSHLAVEEAIRHEMMEVLAEKKSCGDAKGGVVFSFAELKEMKYLHAALCESLRLYHPMPLDYKVATQDDVLPDDSVVKKGWTMD